MTTVQGGPAYQEWQQSELLVQSWRWLLCVLATVMTKVRVITIVSTEQAVLPQYNTLIVMEPVSQTKLHNKHIRLQKLNSQDIVEQAIQHLTAQV